MAAIYPSDLDINQINEMSPHEAQTLAYLAKHLPNQYTVYHSVNWTLANKHKTYFGEIDFIVVDRAGRLLVIEQKNGPLLEEDGGLFKQYAGNKKSIRTQITRNINGLRDQFNKSYGRQASGLVVNYLLYCPDYRIQRASACDIDIDRIVDGRRKDQLADIVAGLLGKDSDPHQAPLVHAFLQRELDLVPDLHAMQSKQQAMFTRASDGLIKVVDNLHMTPFRLKVEASAGCGKSVLAAKYYAESVLAGNNTLLMCFNRPLAEQYSRRLPTGGTITTWNAFKVSYLEAMGQQVDFSQSNDSAFWDKLEDQFEQATTQVPEEWLFDTVIIDEGQDFQPTWWLLLEPFIKPSASVLWLEDPIQNVRYVEDDRDDIAVVYRDQRNYRTPYPIARYIQDTLPFQFEIACPVPGIENAVVEHFVEDEQAQLALVQKAVKRFKSLGISPEQIVILTCKGVGRSVLDSVQDIAGIQLRKFTGEYTPDGDQVLTEGDIRFETVGRFKGKQAPAVILIDLDLSEGNPNSLGHRQRLAYTGMTRATLALEVVHIQT